MDVATVARRWIDTLRDNRPLTRFSTIPPLGSGGYSKRLRTKVRDERTDA